MSVPPSKRSQFHVRLDGLKLSADMEKRIESEIRRVVMEQLASIDLKGDLIISPIARAPGLGGIGGPTPGMVARIS